MSQYIEKEVKFSIDNPNKFIGKLKKLGAKFLGGSFQRTIRFDTKDKKLEKAGKFLRVRAGAKNILTLKIKRKNSSISECEETEFEISDIDKARKAINELGFDYERIMEKYRSDWTLDSVAVSVDELPFGFFVELEGDEDKIFELAEKLGFDKAKKIKETYWIVFEEYKNSHKKENLGESILFDKGHKPIISIEEQNA